MEEQENANNKEELKEKEQQDKKEIEENKENSKEVKATEENKKETEIDKNNDEVEDNAKFKKVECTQKNKKVLPIVISLFVILFIMIFSVIFALLNMSNDKIFKGISILGIDVSDLTVSEATKKINTAIDERFKDENNNLVLKIGENETSVTANTFNAKFDVDNAVIEAYNIGRNGNIVTNNYAILFTNLFKKQLKATLYLDEELLSTTIKDINSKMKDAVVESNV